MKPSVGSCYWSDTLSLCTGSQMRKLFLMRVVRHWHRLSREAEAAPSLQVVIWWGFEQAGLMKLTLGVVCGTARKKCAAQRSRQWITLTSITTHLLISSWTKMLKKFRHLCFHLLNTVWLLTSKKAAKPMPETVLTGLTRWFSGIHNSLPLLKMTCEHFLKKKKRKKRMVQHWKSLH